MPQRVTSRSPAGVRGSVRTCVGCRERAAKSQLLRVVAADRGAGLEAVPDPAGRAPGRGAHLHPTAECLELALRRRALSRALRLGGAAGGLVTTAVQVFVAQHRPRTDPAVPQHRPELNQRTEPENSPEELTRNWSSSS